MAKYTFRIHKGEAPNVEDNGWNQCPYMGLNGISSINDTLDKMPASGKVGTSIPTPFARIYLFKTAFELVTTNPNRTIGVYDALVSDCLDILQLMFEKGADTSKFEFITWNYNSEVSKLRRGNAEIKQRNPNYNALNLLADALEITCGATSDFSQDIILIKYDGMLLGGTSPYTLVYASPNLRYELAAKKAIINYDFSSNKKVPFCGTNPVPLCKRPPEFQRYLYHLLRDSSEGNGWMIAQGGPLYTLWQYVVSQTRGLEELNVPFDEVCPAIIDSKNNAITVNGFSLRFNQMTVIPTESHFMMKPTVEHYRKYMKNIPLVLPCEFSALGWTYVDDLWDTHTQIPDRKVREYGEIGSRNLPKNGSTNGESTTQKYPWVTNVDFLEDTILDLSYGVNTSKFFTPNGLNHYRFLLPIKKEYFMFFTIDDLKRHLTITSEADPIKDANGNVIDVRTRSVTVKLVIPLNSQKGKIEFTRTYVAGNTDAKYQIKPIAPAVGLGIFPFYQLEEKPGGLKNEYSVYLYDAGQNKDAVDLKFYNIANSLTTSLSADKAVRTSLDSGTSKVYNLRTRTTTQAFDLIEVSTSVNGTTHSGLVIPMWTKVPAEDLANDQFKTIFAIDFGTSNTHVAYWDPRENSVHPMEITKDNQQMVMLNAPHTKDNITDFRHKPSFGKAFRFSEYLREFMPPVIGNDMPVTYPIKTATLESLSFNSGKNLFANINIGYDIESERVDLSRVSAFNYKTDLKWALQKDRNDDRARQRVHAFCEQTLWMLKNILVLRGFYSKNIKIIYFYPESMMSDDKNMFENAWNTEAKRIFTDCGFSIDRNNCESELESVAPYYSLLKKNPDIFVYNSANIDIGGGTTDILIMDKLYDDGNKVTAAYETSVQFAGNDIWDKAFPSGTQNGFVEYMKGIITRDASVFPEEIIDAYNKFNRKDEPADLTSFFFKYKDFNFGSKISNNTKLRFVLFIHYASIIWYLSDMIKSVRKNQNPKFVMPNSITFTGKGSEYIKIISPREDEISRLTLSLFLAFGFKKEEFVHGFRITYPENPKGLTAEGGIYKSIADPAIKINFKRKDVFSLDFDTLGRQDTEYENIGASLIGYDMAEGECCNYGDIKVNKVKVMSSVSQFIDAIFAGPELQQCLRGLNMNPDVKDKDVILNLASRSYDFQAQRMQVEHSFVGTDADPVETSLFFLAMKNLLIELSLEYVKNN